MYGASRLRDYVACLEPGGWVHPKAFLLLFGQNHDTVNLRSKSWDEFAKPDAPVTDLVITVCGGAAQETCPSGLAPQSGSLGHKNPAASVQTDWEYAFQSAFDILSRLTRAFTQKPFKIIQPADLKATVKGIGAIS